MRAFSLAALAAAVPACGFSGEPERSASSTTALQGFAAFDLISQATCQLQLNRLKQCVIAPSLHDAAPIDTAVPLRTVVRRQMSGACSTQFALALGIALDGGPASNFAFLSQSEQILRRTDGGPVAQFAVNDASPWTSTAVFDSSCRITLTIHPNEVDVDTVQQAEALLAQIDLELAGAERDVRNYEALVALQAAYTFTRAVANSFHQELSNETMQALRQAAIAAAPAMEIAALGCGDALSEAQRNALFELYVSMVALGDPSSWQNPDGTPKTLEDFYGPGAAEVLAQLEALANQANPDLEAEFRAGLEAAAAERVRVQQKRALALLQLAPWLGATP